MSVLCTGAALVDLLVARPMHWPEPGGFALVERLGLGVGGCGANTAVALARLGVSVEFWARVGADGTGDFLKSQLAAAGIGLRHFHQEPALATKCAAILVGTDGERAFLRTPGGGNAIGREDAAALDWRDCQYLHIGGCYSLRRLLGEDLAFALQQAKAHGLTTSLDTVASSDNTWETLNVALPWIDHLHCNLDEARRLTGCQDPAVGAAQLRRRGAATVVVTLGAEGAWVDTATQQFQVPAFPLPAPLVDTTGAGDAFCAAYLAALIEGHPIETAVRWGNAWGAVAVTAAGATGALHSRSQLFALLER